jgi:hypothetical protein
METIYECILDNTIHFAATEAEALVWLKENPAGKYRNALHRFVINGG